MQVDSVKIRVESAYGFSACGGVQVDKIKTRVESTYQYGFSTGGYNMMNRCQTLLLFPSCAATTRGRVAGSISKFQEGTLKVWRCEFDL